MSKGEFSYWASADNGPGRLQPISQLVPGIPFRRFVTARLFRHTVDKEFPEHRFPEVDDMVRWIESALGGGWQGYAIRTGDRWAYHQRIVRFRFELEEDAVAFVMRFA